MSESNKEWCIKMAELEGDSEIGVGLAAKLPTLNSESDMNDIEKLLSEISSWPWVVEEEWDFHEFLGRWLVDKNGGVLGENDAFANEIDAKFIAQAPEIISTLLAKVKESDSNVNQMRLFLDLSIKAASDNENSQLTKNNHSMAKRFSLIMSIYEDSREEFNKLFTPKDKES